MLGIAPQYYSHIYIWFIAILSLVVFQRYANYPQSRLFEVGRRPNWNIFLLTLLCSFFVGMRPISRLYFVDMAGYSTDYLLQMGEPFVFDWTTNNILFDNYLLFLATHNVPQEIFFLSIAFIYFGCMAWACASLFPRDKMAAFLVCLGAFSTFSYGTNGIKAGAAASIFLVAIALYEKRKLLWAIVFAMISLGFHHSMIVPVAALVVCHFVKTPKLFFAFWTFAFVVALFHITFFQQLFAGFADEQGASYLTGTNGYIRNGLLGGFRIDFIIYSVAPIVVGWLGIYKKQIVSREYSFLLNLYLLSNAIWLLCMYAEFTNRIAYLSWFMLPVVLIYPLLNEEWGKTQYQAFRWIAFGHLGFTLIMKYLFY